MCARKYIVLYLILLISASAFSQRTIPEVDKETYQLYLNKDWKALIKLGKEVQKEEVDFYYLNYRMGIAYYSLKKYRQSIPYFKAAFEVNSDDDKLAEYIYYAYLFSGRKDDAALFWGNLPEHTKNSIDQKGIQFLKELDLYYSRSKISDESILTEDFIASKIQPFDHGIQEISKEYSVFYAGMGHQLSKWLSLNHAYTNLSKRNYFFTRDFDGVFVDEDRQTTQNQYYLGIDLLPMHKFTIKGGLHYLGIKYVSETSQRGFGGRMVRVNDIVKSNEMIYFGALEYDFKNFDLGFTTSYGHLSDMDQLQHDFSIGYYPLGNLNLYTISTFSLQNEKDDDQKRESKVFYQKIGMGIKEKIWIEPFGMFGDVQNFNRANASIVYNSNDVMKRSLGCALIIPLYNAKFMINISYANIMYESSFNEFLKGELDNKTTYNHNTINGGVTWIF